MNNNQSQLIKRRLVGLEIAKANLKMKVADYKAINKNQSQLIERRLIFAPLLTLTGLEIAKTNLEIRVADNKARDNSQSRQIVKRLAGLENTNLEI